MKTFLKYLNNRIETFFEGAWNIGIYENPTVYDTIQKWRETPLFEEFDCMTRIEYKGMTLSPSSLLARFNRKCGSPTPFLMYQFFRQEEKISEAYNKFITSEYAEELYESEFAKIFS